MVTLIYILWVFTIPKKQKCGFKPKTILFSQKIFVTKKMTYLSQKQKPIKNPQNESFDEKNTGFITKYRTKKNIHANAKKIQL